MKKKLEVELRKMDMCYVNVLMCVDRQRSAKLVAESRKQREQLRTLNATQTCLKAA